MGTCLRPILLLRHPPRRNMHMYVLRNTTLYTTVYYLLFSCSLISCFLISYLLSLISYPLSLVYLPCLVLPHHSHPTPHSHPTLLRTPTPLYSPPLYPPSLYSQRLTAFNTPSRGQHNLHSSSGNGISAIPSSPHSAVSLPSYTNVSTPSFLRASTYSSGGGGRTSG